MEQPRTAHMNTIEFELNCVHCGANLQGSLLSDHCTLCGRPIGDTLSPALVDPEKISVSTDVACVGCGYNLRTMGAATLCPECFKPVVDSLRPDQLRFADSKWLRRVRAGVTLLLVMGIGIVLVQIGFFVLGALAAFTGAATSGGFVTARWFGVALLVMMIVVSLVLAGSIYCATSPDPRSRERSGRNRAGTAARVFLLLPVALFLLFVLLAGRGVGWAEFLTPLVFLSLTVSVACTLLCLERLAVRGFPN